jgi:DNA processing protein
VPENSAGSADPSCARARSGLPGSAANVLPGIADGVLAGLLAPVLPQVDGSLEPSGLDRAVLGELFARVALSVAVEPGDQEAGRILEAFGPVAFVRALVEGTDARTMLNLLQRRADDFSRSGDTPTLRSESAWRAGHGDAARAAETPDQHSEPVEGLQRLRDEPVRSRGSSASRAPAPSAAADWGPSLGALSAPRPMAAQDPARSLPPVATEVSRAQRRLAECIARWRSRLSLAETQRVLERAARIDSRLLTPLSDLWPAGLDSLEEGAPLALWIRGDPSRLARLERSIALVGARAATAYGEHVAGESAAGLVDRGFAIVSGGAYGIDAAVHRAAIASGGVTVAFLAGGVDRLYPAGNSELLRRIAATGVLAAELPPGSAPTRWRFLMRNRLIAASATATVVVEAGHRSGSLNTAGHAAQLGRPLGAVPGSILSPASAGTHRLIREYAATCVTSVEEMAELADPLGSGPPSPEGSAPNGANRGAGDPEPDVVAHLSASRAASADEVAARAGLPFATVAAVLGRMDLDGRARERAGGWVLIGDAPRRSSR